jgi:predicted phosphohydrolase
LDSCFFANNRYIANMAVSENQTHLWQQRTSHQLLAELSNALYERELKRLSLEENVSLEQLQKRLGSLP